MPRDMSAAEDAALDTTAHVPDSAVDDTADDAVSPAARVQAGKEAAAENAALSYLAKAREERDKLEAEEEARHEASADEDAAEETPPAQAAKPAEAPAAAAPDADAKLNDVIKRLNAAEARARDAEAKAKEQESRIARAAEWEAAAEAAKNGDATKIFSRLDWTMDTVQKYLDGGPEALKPTIAEKKADAVSQEVASLRAELARRDQQAAIERYKGDLSRRSVTDFASAAPHFARFHTDDKGAVDGAGMAEAIWAVQVAAVQNGEDLSEADAVKRIEAAHATAARRYGAQLGAPAVKAVSGDSAPAKKTETGSTQRVDTAPKKRPPLPKDPREAQALREQEAEDDARALLATLRKKRALEARDDD